MVWTGAVASVWNFVVYGSVSLRLVVWVQWCVYEAGVGNRIVRRMVLVRMSR